MIPQVFRKALRIHPGSTVIFRLEGNPLGLRRRQVDAVRIFEKSATKGHASPGFLPTYTRRSSLADADRVLYRDANVFVAAGLNRGGSGGSGPPISTQSARNP